MLYVIVLASFIKNLIGRNIISSFWVRDIWKYLLLLFSCLFICLHKFVFMYVCVYAHAYWKCYKSSNYNSKNIWLYSTVSSIAGTHERARAHARTRTYTHREREREREREDIYFTYIYIHIYIHLCDISLCSTNV